jgi:hypothetical protein
VTWDELQGAVYTAYELDDQIYGCQTVVEVGGVRKPITGWYVDYATDQIVLEVPG